jgi:enamine deaminase RidA (YjgF/YER057c/UK114 family)
MRQHHRTGALYAHAVSVQAGTFLYLNGQVGTDADGNLVGAGDVPAQTRQAFHNIGLLLAAAGASFDHVVDFTTYLVGREALQPFLETRAEIFPSLFPGEDYPTNTLLIVSGLIREEYLVEIRAVAALP